MGRNQEIKKYVYSRYTVNGGEKGSIPRGDLIKWSGVDLSVWRRKRGKIDRRNKKEGSNDPMSR